jgi:hypothetical protein
VPGGMRTPGSPSRQRPLAVQCRASHVE